MILTIIPSNNLYRMQEVKLGPCIIPDEPVGKHVLEQVAVIKDPDGYTFEVRYVTVRYDTLRYGAIPVSHPKISRSMLGQVLMCIGSVVLLRWFVVSV